MAAFLFLTRWCIAGFWFLFQRNKNLMAMWVYPVHGMLSLAINCTNYPSNGPGGGGGEGGRRPPGAPIIGHYGLVATPSVPQTRPTWTPHTWDPKRSWEVEEIYIKVVQRKPSQTPKHITEAKWLCCSLPNTTARLSMTCPNQGAPHPTRVTPAPAPAAPIGEKELGLAASQGQQWAMPR